jgi:hypothetical protein
MHDQVDDYCLIFDVPALVDQNNVHKIFLIFKCKSETGTRMDVAYVVGVNFGNVKSSRILTFSDASRRYLVSITFTAYVSEYSSYQWLPEGENNKIVYTF